MCARPALILCLFFSAFCDAAVHHAKDKVYIDADAFKVNNDGDEFYIHTGNNVWLVTHTINRDATGMFTYESSLIKLEDGLQANYERKWKCPYCYNYWPIGKPCANPSCPSKYKG